ncbi:Polyketide synthase thioesterase domain-containing protein OS=Kitasatospora aureofaciens OX=1894 GN=GCM10010502_03690 PE=3 SV=1 [Kitasatospora aureofaciens]|uniref:thioesterase II family protein n=1 Tax=Kitasatospora aureofaciens TaxID=1894 RepID=UPI0009286B4D|nr:thioesterase [Streptomyces viridifaciens]
MAPVNGQILPDKWFVSRELRPEATVRLVCFPHAGGATAMFARWPAALGPGVEVAALALPGRERRIGEPAAVEVERITEAVAATADRPYALFGHSMGALLAFEVVRRLRRDGAELPVHLFVSGCPRPDHPRGGDIFDGLSRLPDAELLDRLVRGGGLPALVLDEPELLELVLPVCRADFGWLDAYDCGGEPPVPVPITAFVGTDDASARPEDAAGWAAHTTGPFTQHVVPGGHFFLDDNLDAISRAIRTGIGSPVA